MHKVVLSGGPSTGKTTTFEMLREAYPEAHFIEEAATIVINRELAKQQQAPEYEPIMPVGNYRNFAPLVIARQKVNEAKIPLDAGLVFMDRCIIDNLGYLAHNGVEEYVSEVRSYTRIAGYSIAFFCDWLDKFEPTEVRRETIKEGLAVHQHLEDTYHSSGVPVVHLPAVSVEERLIII